MMTNQVFKKYFITSLLALAFLSLFFGACEKQNTPLKYSTVAVFLASQAPQVQTFTVDPTITQTITGVENTKITFYANSFKDAAGNLVTTPVTVEMKEIYKKGDMIRSNKMTESNGALLESGGEFFLKATAGGQAVYLNQSYKMSVPVLTATSNPFAMDLFIGTQMSADSFTWVPADSAWVDVDTFGQPYLDYNFYFDSLNWINCDYFWNTSNNTVINALPVATAASLTSVKAYLVFTNINSVLELYYDGTSYHTSNVPVGEPATIVMIGMDGTQFYLGTHSFTTTNSSTISVTLSATTEAQLTSTINGL